MTSLPGIALTAHGSGIEEHVGFVLRLAYQQASANLGEALSASGVTPMQFQTLRRLRERGQITQNELGRSVGMPPANIHRMVRGLLASQLVAVAPSPRDKRFTLVELTPKGERTLNEVLPAADAANAHTLSVLSPEEHAAVIDSLWKLASGTALGSASQGCATLSHPGFAGLTTT